MTTAKEVHEAAELRSEEMVQAAIAGIRPTCKPRAARNTAPRSSGWTRANFGSTAAI